MIEINTAILCASVPALKPLLSPRRVQKALYDRAGCGYELDIESGLDEPSAARSELDPEHRVTQDENPSIFIGVINLATSKPDQSSVIIGRM